MNQRVDKYSIIFLNKFYTKCLANIPIFLIFKLEVIKLTSVFDGIWGGSLRVKCMRSSR